MSEWFEDWFGERYLHLYRHRDERDAEDLLALLRRTLPWQRGWKVLDVACGAGRHLRVLGTMQVQAIGLDLSGSLLRRAREVTPAPLVRADLRWLPIRSGTMDLTLNLFTSFGYFETDVEHSTALLGMAGTVKVGGWFVLDYLNAEGVRRSLVPREVVDLGETRLEIERRVTGDGRFVTQSIVSPDRERFIERVRLLGVAELEAMFGAAGLTVTHRFGDYRGAPLNAGHPRTILIGRRR